ncbi:MAG: L-seryl-tRNA(Sec) selenium transferase [Campylobacter sp.]|nr:L-seryl-tRNA(Sec) selenium transferase [Campylobacter sp.]
MEISLPKIDKIANLKEFASCNKNKILSLAKEIIAKERRKAMQNRPYLGENEIIQKIKNEYEKFENLALKPLINATGVVIHTNLGRSVISAEILKRSEKIITNYSNLEFDLNTGKRGNRYDFIGARLANFFGFEDALVVNNNASAVFLVFNTFAKGFEAIVSRGELVEIGGSFRVPEVMASSGAILREVGTTNKTKISDYEANLNENTKMLVKIHRSNFDIVGFSEETDIFEISNLAKKHKLIDYFDLGSAAALNLGKLSKNEVNIKKLAKSGVSLISFSGDKLFGSVQCGIILGKKKLISQLRKNQLLRMLRVDKITISLLDECINAYENGEIRLIPTVFQIQKSINELKKSAEFVQKNIKFKTQILPSKSFVGGGSLPNVCYDTIILAFCIDKRATILQSEFRKLGIIGRIEDDKFCLDFRSIFDKDLQILVEKINSLQG